MIFLDAWGRGGVVAVRVTVSFPARPRLMMIFLDFWQCMHGVFQYLKSVTAIYLLLYVNSAASIVHRRLMSAVRCDV